MNVWSIATSIIVFLTTVLTNPAEYSYTIEPTDICIGSQKPELLVWIHSAAQNVRKRNALRMTWGHKSLYPTSFHIKFLFFVGLPNEESFNSSQGQKVEQRIEELQHSILYEQERYNDLVQGAFHDAYKNLTKKALYSLRWIDKHCREAKFIMKIDDDVLVNHKRLLIFLRVKKAKQFYPESLIICNLWRSAKPVRYHGSKWYISEEEYPDDSYPPFCQGMVYFITPDLVPKLLEKSRDVPQIFMDDVYITGLVANRLSDPGVTYKRPAEEFARSFDYRNDGRISILLRHRIKFSSFILTSGIDAFLELWNFVY